jgi:hypothetical protein
VDLVDGGGEVLDGELAVVVPEMRELAGCR